MGSSPVPAVDWPQLQGNAARTGYTADTIAPPYRARWIWLGPSSTLRNAASNPGAPGWVHNLAPPPGNLPPMPASVPHTISESVQAVVAGGRVFFGTLDGAAHAVDASDGATLWSQPIAGGTQVSACVVGGVVAFAATPGTIHAFDTATGAPAWTFTCDRAVSVAPLGAFGDFFVADHGGSVYRLDAATGVLEARSPRLPGPILGGLAADADSVYVGAEDMRLRALVATTLGVRATSEQLRGQSFRLLWPVVHGDFVFTHTITTPVIGSEYVMEALMDGAASFAQEEADIARWLDGDTNGGAWPDASRDWQRVFALQRSDLSRPFTILAGPSDGVGLPAHPVVVDGTGRVLTYFKTRYPTLTAPGPIFGTDYSVDIAAIDMADGSRLRIDNGQFANPAGWETDNLFGMTIGGTRLFLRQHFRGTHMIDLATSTSRHISVKVRDWDGGVRSADVMYHAVLPYTSTSTDGTNARIGPAPSGNTLFLIETFGVTAVEHAAP